MRYYTRDIPYEKMQRLSWGKARKDVEHILGSMGFVPLDIPQSAPNRKGLGKCAHDFKYRNVWKTALSALHPGDVLVLQYPPTENTVFLGNVLEKVSRKKVRIIIVIHDIVTLMGPRGLKRALYSVTEPRVLEIADKVIVHNNAMARQLGMKASKMVTLGIFDYCIPDTVPDAAEKHEAKKSLPLVIAGNLSPSKAQYLYHLPDNCAYNLYGVGYTGNGCKFAHYMGAFPPDELPGVMRGSFGIVWDGDLSETCSGKSGEYLKFNNPHKTSLYLASGMPVVVWEQAAIADFILENHCGFAVSSLWEVASIIGRMTETEYERMKENAGKVGERIRRGDYLRAAVEKCI